MVLFETALYLDISYHVAEVQSINRYFGMLMDWV